MVSKNTKATSLSSTDEILADALSGPLTKDPKFKRELEEVAKYYEFFDGFDTLDLNLDYGQTWKIKEDSLDYTPTREVRNYARKLIKKQARFMMGNESLISFNPTQEGDSALDVAEKKRILFDHILEQANFWSNAKKALIDATVGKRVLMTVLGNDGEGIKIRFYPMPQFTYIVDPRDSSRLLSVDIVYQDERTKGLESGEQLWHHYKYEMLSNADDESLTIDEAEQTCWLTYALTNGDDEQLFVKKSNTGEEGTVQLTTQVKEANIITIKDNLGNEVEVPQIIQEKVDTELSQIPARVILNESLTGDIYGSSDIKDLITIADNYNRTVSDLRDALKFKMFEQPVVIDGDSKAIQGMKIAPNALVDMKTDPSLKMGQGAGRQAQVTTISGSFNFLPSVQYYLDEAKKAMYELMDQPLPEKIQDAPSGVAILFLFYDLMARCDEKWLEWDSAITWMVSMIEELLEKVNIVYPALTEDILNSWQLPTTLSIKHEYPLPSNQVEKRQVAIQEVSANVRSHSSYISEFGEAEKAETEWQIILEELAQLDEISAGAIPDLATLASNPVDLGDLENDEEENETPSEESNPTEEGEE